jgi:hypothetical protein
MLSEKKKLEIANVRYAHISSSFAEFNNGRNRGNSFSWDWWKNWCVETSHYWMMVHNIKASKATKDAVNDLAREYSKEISDRLVLKLTN